METKTERQLLKKILNKNRALVLAPIGVQTL